MDLLKHRDEYKLTHIVSPFPLFSYLPPDASAVAEGSLSSAEYVEPGTIKIHHSLVQQKIVGSIVKIYFKLKAYYIGKDNKVQFVADVHAANIISAANETFPGKRRIDEPPKSRMH